MQQNLSRINAGDLRHVLTLQTPTTTRTAEGGFQPQSWVNSVTGIRASISPKSGDESMFSDAVRAQMTHLIICRAQNAEILTNQRFYWAGLYSAKYLNIVAVQTMDMIKNMVAIAAQELVGAAASASGDAAMPVNYGIYETQELSFLTTQDVTFTMPDGKRFYADTFEIICTQLTGVIVAQPTVRLGIAGNLTKYRSSLTSVLTAANKRQSYTSLSANEGETGLRMGISVAGSGPTEYKGVLQAAGKLIG